jgi:CRISPR system Cascade subunit CasA
LATIAGERVQAIAKIRTVLWTALAALFDNGEPTSKFSDGARDKANNFVTPFEQGEDVRFFDGPLGLNDEIESDQPDGVRLRWYLSMAERAEAILKNAFDAGPRSGEQRYRARSAALGRLYGGLRSDKTLPTLAHYYREQKSTKETANASG